MQTNVYYDGIYKNTEQLKYPMTSEWKKEIVVRSEKLEVHSGVNSFALDMDKSTSSYIMPKHF